MIVNVRGTNGAGKSHVVRGLMALGREVPLYGALGVRYPEGYRCSFGDVTVYVLGPYHIPTGGCDNFQTDPILLRVLNKYAARGHVLFEGCRISDHWGKVGEWLDARASEVFMAFLPTSLEECLARVEARRLEVGNQKLFDPKRTKSRYRDVERWRMRLEKRFRSVTLSKDQGAQELLEIFRGTN